MMVDTAKLGLVSPRDLSFRNGLSLFGLGLTLEAENPGATKKQGCLYQRRRLQLVRAVPKKKREGRRNPRVVKSVAKKYDEKSVFGPKATKANATVPLGNRHKKKNKKKRRARGPGPPS
jgi:hypothetical protein